ncbi:hypothetical protein RR48_01305 [Papilio machaon]|uniref:Uncharacterized protein n=1 Tax=Papilio machaon TaxID=76193 RepID=A0A0N0PFZ2_PAPMA|nr:hypothetical protein RR48_01305 [Papilio machaon]
MSEDNCNESKNMQMRCLPCVMPYTENIENLGQAGAKGKTGRNQPNGPCHGKIDDIDGSCQCTPGRPCCNFEDVEKPEEP